MEADEGLIFLLPFPPTITKTGEPKKKMVVQVPCTDKGKPIKTKDPVRAYVPLPSLRPTHPPTHPPTPGRPQAAPDGLLCLCQGPPVAAL